MAYIWEDDGESLLELCGLGGPHGGWPLGIQDLVVERRPCGPHNGVNHRVEALSTGAKCQSGMFRLDGR